VYRNNAFATAAFRGSDLVSLFVAVPTLLVSAILAGKGSRRAHLVWLGTLGYVAYTYIYTFGIAFNRLFLVYLALLWLSVFTIVRSLVALDAQDVAGRFGERTPVRGVALFLWMIGGMLGLIDLAQVVPTVFTGEVPELITKTGHLTGVVYIADLGLVVPADAAGGAVASGPSAMGVRGRSDPARQGRDRGPGPAFVQRLPGRRPHEGRRYADRPVDAHRVGELVDVGPVPEVDVQG
jgi:hypothetical protein